MMTPDDSGGCSQLEPPPAGGGQCGLVMGE